ncbi:hypothetical protein K1719_007491 [Acacia pycnantha]|nr:hypothetical protein K1719_007491 [Acacia pycnantha]
MCVELDLTKPLVPEFMVDGQILSVVYESLGLLCRKCGRVGHLMEGCKRFHMQRNDGEMEIEGRAERKSEGAKKEGEGGPWKTVQRVRRQRKTVPTTPGIQGGSRFAALREDLGAEPLGMETRMEQRENVSKDSAERMRDDLQSLATNISGPWLLAGDFNEIKSPLEQKGGGRVNETRCRRFNEWIQGCGLIDVDTKGPFFTWKGPKWERVERVYKRLDRCLCNVEWLEKFENVVTTIVPRLCSDHHPILVNLNAEWQGYIAKSFKYEAIWHSHEKFEAIMRDNWRG